jgi:hypothetical protein
MIEYMDTLMIENLNKLIKGFEITLYQRSLAFQEFNKLIEKAKKYDEIKTKIEGYSKHNNKFFGSSLLEIIGNDIVESFGYKTDYL